jgi:F0F1-type ATP synthase membrane subunit c/vacuolar-type H+-ATPase subunit K
MTSSFPRFLAGLFLVAGGALTGLTAFGISMARWALSTTTFEISASDRALLDDMVALTPFVGAFALVAVIVGFALLLDHPKADIAALAVGGSAPPVGIAGLLLLVLGNDPFTAVPSDRALDGLQIVGTFTAIFAAVVVAVIVARATGGHRSTDPVAGAAA